VPKYVVHIHFNPNQDHVEGKCDAIDGFLAEVGEDSELFTDVDYLLSRKRGQAVFSAWEPEPDQESDGMMVSDYDPTEETGSYTLFIMALSVAVALTELVKVMQLKPREKLITEASY